MGANEKAAYACGGIVIAGLLYLVLALIIRLVGVKKVMRYLPPVVTGPVIICIGLSLGFFRHWQCFYELVSGIYCPGGDHHI